MEPFYPLRALVCERCFLVQLEEFETPERDLRRLRVLLVVLDVLARALPGATSTAMSSASASARSSQVVEVASNDGYLLQYFIERGIPVLGIEPAANVAEAAESRRASRRWSSSSARRRRPSSRRDGQADLLLGNNVLAHVPDLNDFVGGMKMLLEPTAARSRWSSRTCCS